MGACILVGGGARSGKSAFALRRAAAIGPRRCYLATALAIDHEMSDRIARHQRERDGSWLTVEAPDDLATRIRSLPDCDAAVIDCLTLWLGNRLHVGATDTQLEREVAELAAAIAAVRCPVVVVTNEVGLGIVPEHALARRFRDVAGRAHQALARTATEVWFGALGMMLRLRPAPVLVDDPVDHPVEAP